MPKVIDLELTTDQQQLLSLKIRQTFLELFNLNSGYSDAPLGKISYTISFEGSH